ncbi:MAG: dihydrolipoyl dehydrogenase [bacterium]
MPENYDIVILGGGPGGYVAAIRSAQLGFKTAIIEKDNLGGVCLNWGCIPTKSLLKNAELYDLMKNRSADFGIKVDGLNFDFKKIIKRSRDVSTKITKGVDFLIKKNKIDHFHGFGKFISKNELEITDGDEKAINVVYGTNIIIATGARPKLLSSISLDRKNIITSSEAMILQEPPKDLIIIGGGAIGVEFAYFYSTFGTKVTIVEMMNSIVPNEDAEVSGTLTKVFRKRGIEIFTNSVVESAEIKDDKVVATINKNGERQELRAEKILNAIGVVGNIEGFGLEQLGIEIEIERNQIKVNKSTYQTNIECIYAIGDVIGPPWLAHVASAEGIHCVEKIRGLNTPSIDYDSIPACTYCQPQIASIGLTESKAISAGYKVKIGKFPFSASGKSAAIGEREGFVKLIFDDKYGELLGAHIIGSEATELIAELSIIKSMEGTFENLLKTIHAHPTLSESIIEAAANAYGEAIHI